MDCLRPTQGERILDIGSGPGFLVNDIARLVGSTGEVHGVDMADNMVNAARDLCAELPWVCFDVGDAMHLNYADNEFDAVCTTRVYEYVPDLDAAVAEFARVLRPGGRGVILDSDWAAPYWSATDTVLRDRIIAAWSEHCAQQEVPMRLAASIRRAGLSLERVVALPLVNVAYDPDCFSYWGARIIEAFVTGCNGLTAAAVMRWLAGLDSLQQEGRYFFCPNRYLFEISKD